MKCGVCDSEAGYIVVDGVVICSSCGEEIVSDAMDSRKDKRFPLHYGEFKGRKVKKSKSQGFGGETEKW